MSKLPFTQELGEALLETLTTVLKDYIPRPIYREARRYSIKGKSLAEVAEFIQNLSEAEPQNPHIRAVCHLKDCVVWQRPPLIQRWKSRYYRWRARTREAAESKKRLQRFGCLVFCYDCAADITEDPMVSDKAEPCPTHTYTCLECGHKTQFIIGAYPLPVSIEYLRKRENNGKKTAE